MSHSGSVKSGLERTSSTEDELMDLENDVAYCGGVGAKNLELENTAKIRPDTLDEASNASASSTGSKGFGRGLNAREDLDEDDLLEIPFVPPPAVPTQSVAKKRTCVPPTYTVSKQSNQKMFGELKFMADFDPSNSSRNQQKRKKRYHHVDGRIVQYADDFDDCDCLRRNCEGCHFPCTSCGDARCGHECRINRRWLYESIEVEGTDLEIRNPHANSFS